MVGEPQIYPRKSSKLKRLSKTPKMKRNPNEEEPKQAQVPEVWREICKRERASGTHTLAAGGKELDGIGRKVFRTTVHQRIW